MFPVIASIAGFTISSFGLFFILSFLVSFFVIWRIVRLYEVDPEKMIDLVIAGFLSSLLGARIYFILTHLNQFTNIYAIFDIYRHPGLSFWGGLLGGVLVLIILSRRLKLRLWQVADIIMAAFFLGLAVGSLGCFLGSCEYGTISTLPFAVSQVGVLGKRFPVQIIQMILALGVFWYLWRNILRFHFDGQIAGKGLILLGLIKLVTEPFRSPQQVYYSVNVSYVYSLILITLGIWIIYSRAKKSIKQDLSYSVSLISHQNRRKQVLLSARRSWYNLYVLLRLKFSRGKRSLFKILHVKSNPTKF